MVEKSAAPLFEIVRPSSIEDDKTVKISEEDYYTIEKDGFKSGDIVRVGRDSKVTVGILLWDPFIDKGKISLPTMLKTSIGLSIGDKVEIGVVEQRMTALESIDIEIQAMTVEDIDENVINDLKHKIKKQYVNLPFIDKDIIKIVLLNSGEFDLVINTPSRDGKIYKIVESTTIKIVDKHDNKFPVVRWEDIGGMKTILPTVRNLIELPLKHPELWDRYNTEPARGILLHGPPGCGKTMLAKAIASECKAYFMNISPAEVLSHFYGGTESNIKEMFDEAEKNAPTIMFFDEIDAIFGTRGETSNQPVETRMVAMLLAELDGLKNRGRVIVIGATNRPDVIDPAARRPGRLEKEVEIPPPDREGRIEILKIHLKNVPMVMDGEDKVDVEEIADKTQGFVGADLAGLVRDSVFKSIVKNLPNIDLNLAVIPQKDLEKLNLEQSDLLDSSKDIQPSALRALSIEIPDVSFEDVGALEDVKNAIEEAVTWRLEKKKEVASIGIELPKGLLLYGPPGCGKTLVAKAAANSLECNFIGVKGPEFMNKWVGESERKVREVFKIARNSRPCIIFIDEFDAIAPRRSSGETDAHVTERVVAQLLSEMDGIENREDVIFFAATNRPDLIDPALVRKGRIDKMILVQAPDKESRKRIALIHLKKTKVKGTPKEDRLEQDDDEVKDHLASVIAEETERRPYYSGSDIAAIIMEAGINAIRKDRDAISEEDILHGIEEVSPSLDENIVKKYEEIKSSLKKTVNKKRLELNYMT